MPQKDDVQLWPDEQLLLLLRQDDLHAFGIIYNKYVHRLYAVAYNLLRDKQVCEDILQEIFMDLWLKRHSLQINTLQAYLRVAIRNRALMYIRSNKVSLSLDVIEELIEKYHADTNMLHKDLAGALDDGIEHLPERCREIFTLSRKQHLSNKEIAAMLGISIKTVENQITIALRYMRTQLSDYLPLIIITFTFIYF